MQNGSKLKSHMGYTVDWCLKSLVGIMPLVSLAQATKKGPKDPDGMDVTGVITPLIVIKGGERLIGGLHPLDQIVEIGGGQGRIISSK